MCLILFAYRQHADYPLALAANRDEYHERPAAPLGFWSEHPQILAGRDLEAGGTWLGVDRSGRMAALTNVREPSSRMPLRWPRSRGEIPVSFLSGAQTPAEFCAELRKRLNQYPSFNLLLMATDQVPYYFSSVEGSLHRLEPGCYGLSNGALDDDWPKVTSGKAALLQALQPTPSTEALLQVLQCRETAADELLPDTGVGPELERLLAPRFICSAHYGTRSSLALLLSRTGALQLAEHSYDDLGRVNGRANFSLTVPAG